jgi:hypothetical protein
VLYESLTVRETLTYAARLRLPRTMSTPDKLARAEDVMVALSLTRAAGTIIGGFFRRGVSGVWVGVGVGWGWGGKHRLCEQASGADKAAPVCSRWHCQKE